MNKNADSTTKKISLIFDELNDGNPLVLLPKKSSLDKLKEKVV